MTPDEFDSLCRRVTSIEYKARIGSSVNNHDRYTVEKLETLACNAYALDMVLGFSLWRYLMHAFKYRRRWLRRGGVADVNDFLYHLSKKLDKERDQERIIEAWRKVVKHSRRNYDGSLESYSYEIDGYMKILVACGEAEEVDAGHTVNPTGYYKPTHMTIKITEPLPEEC